MSLVSWVALAVALVALPFATLRTVGVTRRRVRQQRRRRTLANIRRLECELGIGDFAAPPVRDRGAVDGTFGRQLVEAEMYDLAEPRFAFDMTPDEIRAEWDRVFTVLNQRRKPRG